jgi:hypothetical protein
MQKDVFDYMDEEEEPKPRNFLALVWNILTVLVLLSAIGIGVVFLTVYFNPNIALNPFPPPTIPARMELPSPTPTPRALLPPTWTPTVAPAIPNTPTPGPTAVPAPTQAQPPDDGPEEEAPVDGMPFVKQDGSPQYIPNIYHPDLGCNWMGVAGQVISLNDAPLRDVFIQLGGILGTKPVDMLTMSGIATQYGQAGYEFTVADEPIASKGTLWVQLLDQAGLPLSEKFFFDTYLDCEKNLTIIYFKQVK